MHYCNIVTNAALLDSQYDRGIIIDGLQTKPSTILPQKYAVPKMLYDALTRLTSVMRNSTDKLSLNVPTIAHFVAKSRYPDPFKFKMEKRLTNTEPPALGAHPQQKTAKRR